MLIQSCQIYKRQLFEMEVLLHKRVGCFVKPFNIIKPGKKKEWIAIPLKSSDYEVQITNNIANINLVQTYINPTDKFLEIQYNFPVDPNACLYRLSAEFGSKRVEGVIREKEEAEKEFKEAVKNGKQAALGQLNPQRGDILNLQIGNVQPYQVVKIQISYLQELTLRSNTFYEFHMSGTISPSYMNQVPKLVKLPQKHVTKTQGTYYWSFKITLKSSRRISFFDSKTHKIQLISQNDTQTELKLAMNSACIPNKDFTFLYTTEDHHLPSYVFGRTDCSSTAMVSFIPKFCDLNLNDAYKASLKGTPTQIDIENARGQYIFLIDRSGSMGGSRIEKAKQALILFIKSLPQQAYFNVFSFGNAHFPIFANSVQYHDQHIKKAIREIKHMNADMGGTEIYLPLERLLTEKPMEGYPRQIFLLTDGAVGNTQQILDLVEGNNKYTRLHTIGIGHGASQELVKGCAKQGKGYHTFISDNENPNSKIIQLLTNSLTPVISKINIIYDKSIIESVLPNPESLPFILKDQFVNFYINFKGQLEQKTRIEFSYEDSLNRMPFGAILEIDPSSQNQSFIDRMGQFKKIKAFEHSLKHNTDFSSQIYSAKKIVDKKSELIDLSVRAQILSSFTSFICIEKELIDGKYEEIISKGQIKVEVQSIKPTQYREKKGPIMYCKRPVSGLQIKPKKSSLLFVKSTQKICKPTLPRYEDLYQPQQRSVAEILDEDDEEDYIPINGFQEKAEICIQEQQSRDQINKDGKSKTVVKSEADIKKLQKRRQKRSVEDSKQPDMKLSIREVISCQLSDGSWKDGELIEKLFGTVSFKIISNLISSKILMTYLIIKWIQKHYPQVEYSLVIKKGNNFIKRSGASVEELNVLTQTINY